MESFNTDNITGKNTSGANSNVPLQRLTATSLIGDSIVNLQGETLGKLHDIMIDLAEGKVEYVVIEFGGFLGINQKYFAVPFQALTRAKEHHHAFVLDETKESMKKYPGFDKEHWPDTNLHRETGTTAGSSFMGANTGSEY
jgi:sporulation protein YlmC with PRC-barrel domain